MFCSEKILQNKCFIDEIPIIFRNEEWANIQQLPGTFNIGNLR